MERPRQVQLLAAAIAAACIVPAGLIQERRATRTDLEEVVPGRAFLVTYLWLRADQLKEQGRYYDAMQQARMICRLQKKFPSVWAFHAWNMGWNISVATHTPEQRWKWVNNAIRLLRDEAIPLNRDSLGLYKELGWIYFFKIGWMLDDMHWAYKRQWAAQMQDLLGAPPQGLTQDVIAAFRPIAEAPLDKQIDRQGREAVQSEKLAELLRIAAVKNYVDLLAGLGVGVGQDFLAAYNRYSMDEAVAAVRIAPPKLQTDRDQALWRAINDRSHGEGRERLLAFVRAQLLWNVYKMDPQWMLKMMEQWGPLDWRLPQPHGLYWFSYGRMVCRRQGLETIEAEEVEALNTNRNVLNCLKELTWWGRLTMIDRRQRGGGADVLSLEAMRPESDMQLQDVELYYNYDPRFIAPTHNEHLRTIQALMAKSETLRLRPRFADNPLRDGHVNYLDHSIRMLYAGYRRKDAQQYYDWLKANYTARGPRWELPTVEEFVMAGLREEGAPTRSLATSQIDASLFVALAALGRGEQGIFESSMQYARKVHASYQANVNQQRVGLPPLEEVVVNVAAVLLVNPRVAGFNLPLEDRSAIYKALPAEIQRKAFARVERFLRADCRQQGLEFGQAFPPPAPDSGAAPAREPG